MADHFDYRLEDGVYKVFNKSSDVVAVCNDVSWADHLVGLLNDDEENGDLSDRLFKLGA